MTTTESRLSRNSTLRSVIFADFRSGRLSREDAIVELYRLDDQRRNLINEACDAFFAWDDSESLVAESAIRSDALELATI